MTHLILLWTLIITIVMSFSTSSFFSLWICLEMNMMMFIPIMNSKTLLSSNSITFYFITQSLASTIFIFFFLLSLINPTLLINNTFMVSAILMKLGAAPFHIWFPEVSEGLKFSSLLVLMTLQKLIPLLILNFMNNFIMLMSLLMSTTVGSLGGWNQNSIRKILAFSSITHIGWMISLIMNAKTWWLMYFFIYSFIITTFIFFVSKMNISFISQISFLNEPLMKISFIMTLLSLGGMPPMLGFLVKLLTIKIIILSMPMILLVIIPSSLLNLFFYMRIMYPFLMKMFHYNQMNFKKKKMLLPILAHCLSLFVLIPLL
uniref:NADH-ubiquinone oxidoreductase chain 2 n=1 Tax=Argas lagenoplastis TaxID=182350 RepID=W0FDE5_ARGLA|nr:NADH dehydrogenase subunit 2 [Argas lagenoplastis]AHF21600.1 NADH dehydrogenase subunit 2 [Argas lagenoplastis]